MARKYWHSEESHLDKQLDSDRCQVMQFLDISVTSVLDNQVLSGV